MTKRISDNTARRVKTRPGLFLVCFIYVCVAVVREGLLFQFYFVFILYD